MKMKTMMKIKNGSHRYNISSPRSRHIVVKSDSYDGAYLS